MNWFQVLQTYGERDMVDEDDPDFDLTLKLVEKVVVRKIFGTFLFFLYFFFLFSSM